MKKIIIILLFLNSVMAFSQVKVSTIGFHCYEDGSPTEIVRKFTKLLFREKFKNIISLLESKNNSEKFLAALVCEQLNNKQIKLTHDQLQKINGIKTSDDIVSVCEGCTYRDKISMKNLYRIIKEKNYFFDPQFKEWLAYCLKKE